MAASPVVANGVLLPMSHPSLSPTTRLVTFAVAPLITFNTFPLAIVGLFSMSGVPVASVAPVSLTLWNGQSCALQGSLVTCVDGYYGTFLPSHTAGANVLVT